MSSALRLLNQGILIWMSGAKVMGLETQVRKLGKNLLVWKEGYTDANFGNLPRAGQFAKNCETIRVDVSGCTACESTKLGLRGQSNGQFTMDCPDQDSQ